MEASKYSEADKQRDNRVIKYLRFVALALSMAGAIVIATGPHVAKIGFSMWIVANIIWLKEAEDRKDNAQMILWTFYLFTAVLSFINY
jgi:hypothetical protein